MKTNFFRFGALTVLLSGLAISLARAQTRDEPLDLRLTVLRGEAEFLERLALPPRAKLHVSLIGRVAGAEYLPLATTVIPARNGITPFRLSLDGNSIPSGPYRLQAWVVADNRLWMQNRDAQTTVENLDKPAKIRLKMVSAPQNIDGIGDGKALPMAPQKLTLKGSVSKLDRRALNPDSRIEINLRDVSLADAPSKLVVGQVIQLEGGQLPKPFELALEAGDLQPRRRYSLSARVFEAGKLTYITDTSNPVSPDDLAKNFELRVVAVPQTP